MNDDPTFHVELARTSDISRGTLKYIAREFSFRFDYRDRSLVGASYAILFGNVQIDVVAASGLLIGAWGYLPVDPAMRSVLAGGNRSGFVHVQGIKPPPRGVVVLLADQDSVSVEHDNVSGWTRVGLRDAAREQSGPTLFSDGCAAEVTAVGALVAVWLRPTMA
jgi:hypothetical protein